MNLFEIFCAKIFAVYWETLYSNSIPYLGASLFPNKRMQGLRLDWIKGADQLPFMLMPSAFDAKPVLRDRGGVASVSLRMPFFRESMRIGEEERQQLLTMLSTNEQFAAPLINKIYDDMTALVDSAILVPEVMRFSLMQTGTITIQSPNESGINVSYNYNYDPNGKWAADNVIELMPALYWGEPTAHPIADILAVKRAAQKKGTVLTRAIISSEIWGKLLTNTTIGKDIFPLAENAALSDSDLQRYLVSKTGITFTVYEKMYKDLSGVEKPFMMPDRVIFLPASSVGNTFFGTTPEEADLMTGNVDADVSIVGGGIAVLTKKESLPVNIVTAVSEIVLPSFENMNKVYVLIVDEEEA